MPEKRLIYPLAGKRIWVAGHRGMIGSAIVRRLRREECRVIVVGRETVDLTRQSETEEWLAEARPDAVFMAAAKVGGILANDRYPVDFLYDNLMIEANILNAAAKVGVEKLMLLGSSCIYPKHAPQPIQDDALMTGPLEPTNEWYAVAKIAGVKLTQAYRRQAGCDFIAAMPTNLYGPGDNYDLETSHVIAALIRKAHEARQDGENALHIWGTGTPRREFLYADDCADGLIHLMKTYSGSAHVNVGYGSDVTIRELAELVMQAVGLEGSVVTDPSKPDGTPRKLMDSSLIRSLGWSPQTDLKKGLALAYSWFVDNVAGAQSPRAAQ